MMKIENAKFWIGIHCMTAGWYKIASKKARGSGRACVMTLSIHMR